MTAVASVALERCQRCNTGIMTPFIDEGEGICFSCGWVHYVGKTPEPIKETKKRGRPKGYSRQGQTRLD